MTTTRLVLVRHASTDATRQALFPLDEPLDRHGIAACEAVRPAMPRADAAWSGPSARTRETARALGLDATVDAALDECDFGTWRGRGLPELHAEDPEGVTAWMTDPAAAPHGGESVEDLLARVAAWMGTVAGRGDRTVAVTHAGVVRAAIVVALQAPAMSFWRVDVAPLSHTVLHEHDGRWTLRSTGAPA